MGTEHSVRRGPSRRSVIGTAGVAGTAAMIGGGLARPAFDGGSASLDPRQSEMVLRVARAGANVPVRFPSFGEKGPPESRATQARLDEAVKRLDPQRLARVVAGADALLERGAADRGRARLLSELGRLAGDPAHTAAVEAVAALAITTVSSSFDPNSSHPASLWVGGLRHLDERGQQPTPITHLETRR